MPLAWTGIVVGSLLAGAALGALLVVQRRREPFAILVAALGMTMTVIATGVITTTIARPTVTILAAAISIAAFGGGYALVAAVLGSLRHRCAGVDLPRRTAEDQVLTILLADLEPETYQPSDVTRQILDLTDAGLPEPSLGVLPFFYASQKARYRGSGNTSPEIRQARALAEQIESLLDSERFAGPVVAACADGDTLTRLIPHIAEAGFHSVVVACPYIADSFRLSREKRSLDALRLGPDDPTISYAPALAGSERIAQMITKRVVELVAEPDLTGVALVMHGQPGDFERTYAEFDTEENTFANGVRMSLAEHGIPIEQIRLCWTAWRDPDVTETVRHLAAFGSTRVLVVPVTYPFENLDTLLELPTATLQARVPDTVHVVQVPPWRDAAELAGEIADSIERATSER